MSNEAKFEGRVSCPFNSIAPGDGFRENRLANDISFVFDISSRIGNSELFRFDKYQRDDTRFLFDLRGSLSPVYTGRYRPSTTNPRRVSVTTDLDDPATLSLSSIDRIRVLRLLSVRVEVIQEKQNFLIVQNFYSEMKN